MKKLTGRNIAVIVFIAGCLVFGSSLWAKVEFRGRLLTGSGGVNTPQAVNVRIIIENYTTEDEVRTLQQFLVDGNQGGFLTAFRSMKKGEIRFFGGMGLNIPLHGAMEIPNEKGLKIQLLAESQTVEPGANQRRFGPDRFLVVELFLDKEFNGNGKIYQDAVIQFTPKSEIKLDSFIITPKELIAISLVR
jgi:hypothetical protein